MGSDQEGRRPRQLAMVLDSVALEGLSPEERRRLVVLLAQLLLEAACAVTGNDHESH